MVRYYSILSFRPKAEPTRRNLLERWNQTLWKINLYYFLSPNARDYIMPSFRPKAEPTRRNLLERDEKRNTL